MLFLVSVVSKHDILLVGSPNIVGTDLLAALLVSYSHKYSGALVAEEVKHWPADVGALDWSPP